MKHNILGMYGALFIVRAYSDKLISIDDKLLGNSEHMEYVLTRFAQLIFYIGLKLYYNCKYTKNCYY